MFSSVVSLFPMYLTVTKSKNDGRTLWDTESRKISSLTNFHWRSSSCSKRVRSKMLSGAETVPFTDVFLLTLAFPVHIRLPSNCLTYHVWCLLAWFGGVLRHYTSFYYDFLFLFFFFYSYFITTYYVVLVYLLYVGMSIFI